MLHWLNWLLHTLLGCFYKFWSWYPPVGIYIALLALGGVLVPLYREWNKISKRERSVWTALMFLLVGLEIKSIIQDRNEHEEKEAHARKEQLDRFGKIADKMDTAITGSERQFEATMERSNKIFGIAREDFNFITGDDSYCIFSVAYGLGADQTTGNLLVTVDGKYPMRDVIVEFQNGSAFPVVLSLPSTILPGGHPTGQTLGLGRYLFRTHAANGDSTEELNLSLDQKGRIVESYNVWKNGIERIKFENGKTTIKPPR